MKKNTPFDIWKFVDKKDKKSCWNYVGSTFSGRYGRFFLDGKAVCAHRVVYQLCNGEIPSSLFVMHKCNNKLCCNPNHLTTGTNSENQRHASMSGAFNVGKSGVRGVSFIKSRGYWHAQGYKHGKMYNLYTGPSYEKAILARSRWEKLNGITFERI